MNTLPVFKLNVAAATVQLLFLFCLMCVTSKEINVKEPSLVPGASNFSLIFGKFPPQNTTHSLVDGVQESSLVLPKNMTMTKTKSRSSHFERFAYHYEAFTSLMAADDDILVNCGINKVDTLKNLSGESHRKRRETKEKTLYSHLLSSIAVPSLLLMVNDDVWNFPPRGPHKILMEDGQDTPKYRLDDDDDLRKKLRQNYQPILDELANNEQISLSKDVYVPTKNFPTASSSSASPNYHYLSFRTKDVNRGVDHINDVIANKTFGTIKNELVPHAGWFGAPFGIWTEADFIQTFYYKSDWTWPFKSIGLKNFGLTTKTGGKRDDEKRTETEFFEAEGNFPFFEGTPSDDGSGGRLKIVQIPLLNEPSSGGKRNSLILILQENSTCFKYSLRKLKVLKNFLENNNNNSKKEKHIKIQIPQFNMSTTLSHGRFMMAMGMNDMVCNSGNDTGSTRLRSLFGMAEHSRINLRANFLEISSVAGTSVYDPKKLKNYIQGKISEDDDDNGAPFQMTVPNERGIKGQRQTRILSSELKKVQRGASQSDQNGGEGEPPDVEVKVAAAAAAVDEDDDHESGVEVIRFGSAFTWIFMDDRMGPLFFGNFEQPQSKYDEHVQAEGEAAEGFSWLADVGKMALWGCP